MSDDATARNIVDLAMDDKPNKAGVPGTPIDLPSRTAS